MEALDPGCSLFVELVDPWPLLLHFLLARLAILWFSLLRQNLLVLLQCTGAYVYVNGGITGKGGGTHLFSFLLCQRLPQLQRQVSPLDFGRDANTKVASSSLGFWKARLTQIVILQWLDISPSGELQSPVILDFQKGCQNPKKKSCMRLLVA